MNTFPILRILMRASLGNVKQHTLLNLKHHAKEACSVTIFPNIVRSRRAFWQSSSHLNCWVSNQLNRNGCRGRPAPRTLLNQCTRRSISAVGAEPGANLTGHDAGSVDSKHKIEPPGHEIQIHVIDYSSKNITRNELTVASLETFLTSNKRPEWATCRWIYVNGLDAGVVNTLGNIHGLHRLTVEDVMDTTTPTKVDWYEDHCFMELPLQKVYHFRDAEHDHVLSEESLKEALRRPNRRILSRKLGIAVEQVSLFLTSDNTVITIFEHSGQDVLTPILTRLNSPQTIVRSTNDPWVLVQAVIDAVVDLSLPIGKAVADVFGELEYAVLSSPAISQSKELYVLRSGLTLLMDNTNSLGGLVRTLCDHQDTSAQTAPSSIQISPITRVYLQDVLDHITTLSNSTKMSIRSAEHLTSLIFSTIAASQNESVRQLTLVSCFFLPLTFLTGYFGMNFDPMPVVNNHSDAFFWVIATPIMLTILMILGIRSQRAKGLLRRPSRRSGKSVHR